MLHHSFCAQLIASHKFYPYSFFTLVCHAVLNFAISRRFRRVGVTVMWVPAWPAVLNCANNSPIEKGRQTFTRREVEESSRRRAGRWRSPAVAAHCPPVGPSPHPTSTEAKRSRARSQSSRRRPLSADPADDAPPPTPPMGRALLPRSVCVLATPPSSTPLIDRRAEGAGRRRGRRGAGRGRRGAGRALE
jgi:hypothetical protein